MLQSMSSGGGQIRMEKGPAPETICASLCKWTIDYSAKDLKLPVGELLVQGDLEFPRIDDRYAMSSHSHTFYDAFHPDKVDFSVVGPRMGGGYPPYNTIGHLRQQHRGSERILRWSTKICAGVCFRAQKRECL